MGPFMSAGVEGELSFLGGTVKRFTESRCVDGRSRLMPNRRESHCCVTAALEWMYSKTEYLISVGSFVSAFPDATRGDGTHSGKTTVITRPEERGRERGNIGGSQARMTQGTEPSFPLLLHCSVVCGAGA